MKITRILMVLAYVSFVVCIPAAIADSITADDKKLAPDITPVVTPIIVTDYKGWKGTDRFDFSYISGFQQMYNPREEIVFSVEGIAQLMDVSRINGFYVEATLFDRNDGKGADVHFEQERNLWRVKLTAPQDHTRQYHIVVNLYCGKKDSPCADAYGFRSQVDKHLPLLVR